MKKKILFVSLLVSILLMSCSSAATNDSSLGKGKTMALKFVTNPSTGFDWEYKFLDGDDKGALHLDREDYNTIGSPDLMGASSERTYYFVADKAGKQSLTFTYRRPWEGGEVLYDVVYELNIDKDLNIICLSKSKGVVESKEELSFFPDPTFE